jgi:hypothetical protein
MIHQFWRLNDRTEANLGLACTGDGLFLGRTPLVERRDGRFVMRERTDLARLLGRVYQNEMVADRLTPGLAIVAAALNANDRCLAHIAAVHLRIPDLPNEDARAAVEAEDALIKSEGCKPFPRPSGIRKASPDDPKHPGWPAGSEGGRGGEFRPKDGSTATVTQEIKRRITRNEMRLNLVAALHIGVEALANLIPGIDVAADVVMAADIARTASEFTKLAIDAAAALDFVKDGPHNLEDLQV